MKSLVEEEDDEDVEALECWLLDGVKEGSDVVVVAAAAAAATAAIASAEVLGVGDLGCVGTRVGPLPLEEWKGAQL